MSIINDWVNPYYLDDDVVDGIRESILAKPIIRYAVLDNFFKQDKFDELISHHAELQFSEKLDRTSPKDGSWLPYDGAVCFAKNGVHFGSELFFDDEWHRYCCYITSTNIQEPIDAEIKLRYHKPQADGFWIHTDSTIRSLVVISYFNKQWKASDGGMLQLWRVDEGLVPGVLNIDSPSGRMNFLTKHKRISTSSPGGGFDDNQRHDLVLVDQIVPLYNRVFICNLKHSPAYHSVTPSNGRARLGFVQWLYSRK